jgi:hypothetical protein
MKSPAITRLFVLLCLFADPLTALAQQSEAPKLRSFLGWMPMQPVTAGGRLQLDMHRFYFSKPGAGDEVVLPEAEPGKFNTRFDTPSFTLGVQVDPAASGPATLAAELFAASRGAGLIRTHDVAALRQALDVWQPLASVDRISQM